MSWLDILEGLSAGGSRALEQYGSMKQAERDRAEREKQRQEDIAYRQRMMDLQERQFAASEARALEERNRRIQEAINKGELTKAQERLNLDAIRESMPEAEDIGDARSLFTGAGMGMAAQKAPGQTYAAQKMREESPSALVRPSMSFIDEVPEFEPRETYMERGTAMMGDQAFRPTTRAEIAAMEADAEDLEIARGRERRALEVRDDTELSDYQKRYYILTGTIPAPEREIAQPDTRTAFQKDINYLVDELGMTPEEALAYKAGRGGVGGAGTEGDPVAVGIITSLQRKIADQKVDPTDPLSRYAPERARRIPYEQEEIDEMIEQARMLWESLRGGTMPMGGVPSGITPMDTARSDAVGWTGAQDLLNNPDFENMLRGLGGG